jgi:hypothetical protein
MKRRELVAAAAGTAAAGAALWPLGAAVLEPLQHPDAVAPGVDVASEQEVPLGAPFKTALRVPLRDGFFITLVEAGAVWLQRRASRELSRSPPPART